MRSDSFPRGMIAIPPVPEALPEGIVSFPQGMVDIPVYRRRSLGDCLDPRGERDNPSGMIRGSKLSAGWDLVVYCSPISSRERATRIWSII
jgi:hypothetical protein